MVCSLIVELQLPACGCHGILRAGEPQAADHLYRDEILCIRKYFYHRIVLDVAPASSSCVGDSFSFIIGIIYIIIGHTEEGVAPTTEMTALGTKGLYPLPQSSMCPISGLHCCPDCGYCKSRQQGAISSLQHMLGYSHPHYGGSRWLDPAPGANAGF